MSQFNDSLARTLNFGEGSAPHRAGGRTGLRLALAGGALRGPDKYKVLEHRRHQAQIRARRLLELMEGS